MIKMFEQDVINGRHLLTFCEKTKGFSLISFIVLKALRLMWLI